MPTALAVDLGSSSGRVLAGTLVDGRVEVREVHRFANVAHDFGEELAWDLDYLWDEIVCGLKLALASFEPPFSVSVDTWGVDFVLLDQDQHQVGRARAYRDDRTTRTREYFRSLVTDEEFFELTGIAPATINSVNQLVALLVEQPELAARCERVLFLPDYFTWRLSGVMGWSRSIASTSGLCGPGAKSWANLLFDKLKLPRSWFGDLTDELSVVGQCAVPGLEEITVVRAGAHDTACAVHGLPIDEGKDAFFLSCGSWSVLGAVLDEPVSGKAAYRIGLTNEVRTDGGVRPLFNLTGLWILQECQRQWASEGIDADIVQLVEAAKNAESCGFLIDPDDPTFAKVGGMVQRISDAITAQGGTPPESPGQVVRIICESLAARYARGVADLAAICGKRPNQLNVVGGGSRNDLLCALTARRAGLPVVAGPAEAATLGSMVAQFETLGQVSAESRPALIAASAKTLRYEPGYDK